ASFFIVTKPNTQAAGNYRMLWLGVAGTTNDQVVFDQISSTQWRGYVLNGATASSVTASGLSTSSYQVLSGVYNGSNTETLFSNSAKAAQSTSMQTANNVSRGVTIAAYNLGSGAPFTGNIAEMVVYNTALTPTQRQAVEAYLAHKYALYVNPPTISPPTGV